MIRGGNGGRHVVVVVGIDLQRGVHAKGPVPMEPGETIRDRMVSGLTMMYDIVEFADPEEPAELATLELPLGCEEITQGFRIGENMNGFTHEETSEHLETGEDSEGLYLELGITLLGFGKAPAEV